MFYRVLSVEKYKFLDKLRQEKPKVGFPQARP